MRNKLALLTAVLLSLTAFAVDAPESIVNANLEVRTGRTPTTALDDAARGKSQAWVGWSVQAVPEAFGACCFTNNLKRTGCSLADRDNSWGTTDELDRTGPTELYVLVESNGGRPSRVRLMSSSCPVDGAGARVIWLGPVDAVASLAALSRLLDAERSRDKVGEPALAAIAHHIGAAADDFLEKRAFDRSLPKEAREQAIFWAGNVRGDAGLRLIERVLASEPNGDLREHAVFALTQSSVPYATDRIKRVAIEDRDNDVRAQALFWLAQTDVEGAGEWIVGRLDAEQDDRVREQAVFALSQLDDGTNWLLKVLQSKRDAETIRRALFWLAQSDDPRALEEISKILDR